MIEKRNVTVSVSDIGMTSGYREFRKSPTDHWQKEERSDFFRCPAPYFAGGPRAIMAEMGLDVSKDRAAEFSAACDSDFAAYYYLAVASEGVGDEALKWIMGSLSAELNAAKLPFSAISTLMRASVLNEFASALVTGTIDRSFAKPIFAELLKKEQLLADIIADPRFKVADDSEINSTLDRIIAENPVQFEKARNDPKVVQWFVGQMMKAMQGKAKPPLVITKMQERLAL